MAVDVCDRKCSHTGARGARQPPWWGRARWRSIAAMRGEAATREQTIEAFLARSKRKGTVGIRMSFLQPGRGLKAGKGVLSPFAGRRDELALDLYLLLILIGRGSRFGKHFVEVQSGVWSRALG